MSLAALSVLILAAEPAAPTFVYVLSLDDAVNKALANQPTLRVAAAQTRQARAISDEVFSGAQARRTTPGAGFLPLVTFLGTYNRHTLNQSPGVIPGDTVDKPARSASPFKMYNFFSGTMTVQQLLYDFGQQTNRWKSASVAADSQALTENAVRLQTIFNVRIAYFAAQAERALVAVAHETLQNEERHLKQTEGFVRVGNQPQIALAQSRTTVANARYQVTAAQNNFETGKAQLNAAMGLEGPAEFDVRTDPVPPVDGERATIEVLVDEALRSRPEVNALNEQIRAQDLQLRALRSAYAPDISASFILTDRGPGGPVPPGVSLQYFDAPMYYPGQFSWNLNAELIVTWPIFDGLLVPAQIRAQQAVIDGLVAQKDALRQQVRLAVEQARLAVSAAKENVIAAEEALNNAQIQLKLADGRYQQGVGNIIELGDAQVARTAAAAQRVQADFNLATARAQLLQALGRL